MKKKIRTLWSHKITPAHLALKAVVYLRQSDLRQVKENLESQRLQYALVERAQELGWNKVEVFDGDLGKSASLGARQRQDFEVLIALVALGEVGIIFSRELSRLFRTDKDFCRLMEICGHFNTLLADDERVYDLNDMDDQLNLGIKGTMSVVELKVLKKRLLEGMEAKAARGELYRSIPPGYIVDASGAAVKDPDERVRDAIDLVFRKFREVRSVRQTHIWFNHEGIELPVNKPQGGSIQLVWQLPSPAFIGDVLHNAFYAGAYVYGRRPTEMVLEKGKLVKRQGRFLMPEECRVFIRDHHEGYIEWETYEENRKIIRGNSIQNEGDESMGAVRCGQGFLSGLLRCARCGRKLHVRYWGKSGTAARYLCPGDFHTGGRYCLGFGGKTVDRRFDAELLRVLSPLGMEASLKAAGQLSSKEEDKKKALAQQLKQVEYEAQRGFEQYNEVDARNRLVAQELERRWNEKLEEAENIRSALKEVEQESREVSDEEREKIWSLGMRFPEVWKSDRCPPELRKQIVRTVMEDIIVELDDEKDILHFIIHWKGGTHTEFEMDKPRSGVGQKTATKDLEIIREMAVRYRDDEIARVLNKLGRKTGKGKRWNQNRVWTARRNHKIAGQKRSKPNSEILSLGGAAKHCRVSQTTIKRLVASGLLKKDQVVPWAPWEIRISDLESEPISSIIEELLRSGKLVLKGVDSARQQTLFL